MAVNGDVLGSKTQDNVYPHGSLHANITKDSVGPLCGNIPSNLDDNVSTWGADDVAQGNECSSEGECVKDVAFGDEFGNNDKASAEKDSTDEKDEGQDSYSSSEDTVVEVDDCIEEYEENMDHVEAGEVYNVLHVCGKDANVPKLSDYEKLREKNIKERNEAMKDVMIEINEVKQDLSNDASKKRKVIDCDRRKPSNSKRRKVDIVAVRRSERERKPVSYVVEGDMNDRSWKRGGFNQRRKPSSVLGIEEKSMENRKQLAPGDALVNESSRRVLRPRKPVCYTEMQEPDADSYIWCSGCDRLEYHGCEVHTTLFGDNKMFKLVVSNSSVKAKNAGLGVFNKGTDIIPEGTLFGPYSGKFIPLSTYQEIEKQGKESGNGWEVKDKEGKKIVGYIDPGLHPNPEVHWMSKVNCAMDVIDQNLVGFQLAGQIYYRALKDIPTGRELLVYYGDSYANGLGIDVKKYDLYRGKEDQTKGAVVCQHCSTGMGSEELAEKHLCHEKRDVQMVRKGKTGERSWICLVCGKGFLTRSALSQHGVVHTKFKEYLCSVDGCDKRYTLQNSLYRHRRAVHEGFFIECYECGRRFGYKPDMERHFKTVHLKEKDYKCPTCGVNFRSRTDLSRHIDTVHKKVKAFECQHCSKSFGTAATRQQHIEAVHLGIRYSCTWEGCEVTVTKKTMLPFHVRRVHTKEWSWECQLCEDQQGIWWGCITPGEMDKHKAKNHPVEWEQQQENYRREHPHICGNKKCLKRFATRVEVERHMSKLH